MLAVDELVVDSFAGGGGASVGIERALGRSVDIAINHSADAIAMHRANHPSTRHLTEDVWKVDPLQATGGRPVGLLWASPDCKHFSRAKGGKPVEKRIRSLAWVVVRWARDVRPRVICLENVREFAEWGPLLADNRPCRRRKGQTFRRWVRAIEREGYDVDWRELNAADFGAPTHRRRLFLVARRDGEPICWPEPTHGPGRAHPWRAAASIIDWSLPCPSIFARKRPLAPATMRRIALGLDRFVLRSARPFIVSWWGERRGQEPRVSDTDQPLPTVVADPKHAVVAPHLVVCNHGRDPVRGGSLEDPMRTIAAARDAHGLVLPYLVANNTNNAPRDPCAPLGTVTTGERHMACAAFLSQFFGGMVGKDLREPKPTCTAIDHDGIVAAHLETFRGTGRGADVAEPAPAITAGGEHLADVRAFLVKYLGTCVGQDLYGPLHTATTKDRFGLVTVEGVDYQIADIGLRMLTPRELARAQGFPESYVLTGTRTKQIAHVGNSVVPAMSEAIVRANLRTPALAEAAS